MQRMRTIHRGARLPDVAQPQLLQLAILYAMRDGSDSIWGDREPMTERLRDYSQPGDPYGIAVTYTHQSAAAEARSSLASPDHDIRGNSLTRPRGIPTQAEADAIARGSR